MKKYLLPLVILAVFSFASCEEKIDIEKEKEAIIALIEEETASYYASDSERWSAVFLQDSTFFNITALKTGFNYSDGWESFLSDRKEYIEEEREESKYVRTPIRIKIYEESAWVVCEEVTLFNDGKTVWKQLLTYFLEKQNSKWKIVYTNMIQTTSYYLADYDLLNSINYAKSLGKSVESYATFAGDQYKALWNQEYGYEGFMNYILDSWRNSVCKEDFTIMEQDDSHVVFAVNNIYPFLKSSGSILNVTYDEYLKFLSTSSKEIADYMNSVFQLRKTQDGIVITISKK
jgi:hypothetical protein